jgi:DNA polymerase-3 subunit gamma/tau
MKDQSESTVLYRKYRPKTFAEVVGQSHVVDVLESAIKGKKTAHAYLFFGPRGTGKTSIARIFASALGAGPTDIIEIDAASNTGVDDIRELRDTVASMPFASAVKVYIIDEVHMLSKSAFNALLKTLEEPPKHVIFILATTEKEKVPETVVSRCQSFTFKMPSKDALKKFVMDVAKKEGKPIDAPSADIVAQFGDGSFRDSLVHLQQVLSSAGTGAVDAKEVARLIGAPAFELVNDLITAVAEGKVDKGLETLAKAVGQSVDMKTYLKLVLEKLRAVLFLRYAPEMKKTLEEEFTPDDLALLSAHASDAGKRINSHTLVTFLDAFNRMGYSVIPSLPIELALIEVVERENAKKK